MLLLLRQDRRALMPRLLPQSRRARLAQMPRLLPQSLRARLARMPLLLPQSRRARLARMVPQDLEDRRSPMIPHRLWGPEIPTSLWRPERLETQCCPGDPESPHFRLALRDLEDRDCPEVRRARVNRSLRMHLPEPTGAANSA